MRLPMPLIRESDILIVPFPAFPMQFIVSSVVKDTVYLRSVPNDNPSSVNTEILRLRLQMGTVQLIRREDVQRKES